MIFGWFGIFYAFSLRVVALQSARYVSEQVCGAPGAGAEQRSDHPCHRHRGGLLRRALAQVRTLFYSSFTNNADCLQVFLPDAVRGAPAPPQVRPGDDVHGGAAREGVPQEQAQGRGSPCPCADQDNNYKIVPLRSEDPATLASTPAPDRAELHRLPPLGPGRPRPSELPQM